MSEQYPADSVGLVSPQRFSIDQPLALECGRELSKCEVVYETYGQLNNDASNALLICPALSGDHHAAGYHSPESKKPGWWENCIGPGKPMDTNRFFVVCTSNLGGYKGSTGPSSINPASGKPYGPDFPIVTVRDWVRVQNLLGKSLGITQWAAVVGGSLGGMQALQWAIDFPDQIRHAVIIAAAPKLSAQNIAFNEIARQSIVSDPDFREGRYEEANTAPKRGLMLARMLGHITYLSDSAMRAKFGRDLRDGKINFGFDAEFQVESYLRHQGKSFVDRFDANTYLLMTKALDYFDPAREYNDDLAAAFAAIKARCMVASFSSDWRFSSERSREIVDALITAGKDVSYAEIESNLGHDDFLLTQPKYIELLARYFNRIYAETGAIV